MSQTVSAGYILHPAIVCYQIITPYILLVYIGYLYYYLVFIPLTIIMQVKNININKTKQIRKVNFIYITYPSKCSSGLSSRVTITGIAWLAVINDFKLQRYSICCGMSFDVGSTGIVRNTNTFTAPHNNRSLI